MNKKQLPPIETLRKLLRYEPDTGLLFWRERTPDIFSGPSLDFWNSKYAGEEAFTSINGTGYNVGSIYNKIYRYHRIAWAIHYGVWPEGQIDHINHIKTDNRISNLRSVSARENLRNQSINKNNRSGTNGVCWNKRDQRWRAQIGVNGKTILIGSFQDKSSAIRARELASQINGFHKNHGKAL